MTLKVVIAGNSVRADLLIEDYDETAYDPTSHSIQLYEPDGTASGSPKTSPTNNDTGDFSQEFDIPADAEPGNWRIRWETTTSGKKHSEDVWFEVKP